VDAGHPVQLTRDIGFCRDPASSPDGSKILVTCGVERAAVYVVPTLGGSSEQVGEGLMAAVLSRWVADLVCEAARQRSSCLGAQCEFDDVIDVDGWSQRFENRRQRRVTQQLSGQTFVRPSRRKQALSAACENGR